MRRVNNTNFSFYLKTALIVTTAIASCSKSPQSTQTTNIDLADDKVIKAKSVPLYCEDLANPCADPACYPYYGCAPLFTEPIPSTQIGAVHNQAINAIDSKFAANNINPQTVTRVQLDNYTKTYMYQFFQENGVNVSNSEIATAITKRNTMMGLTSTTTVVYTNLIDVKTIADSLLNLNNSGAVLTVTEKQILPTLFVSLEQFHDNLISHATLNTKITQAETSWNGQNFNVANHQGYISANAINVAKNSSAYWAAHQTGGPTVAALPIWVGMDAVGALAGGIGAAIEGGSWGSIGRGALVWGIAGSIPSTRWFKSIFR